MPLKIIHSDITLVQADVIVNSANPYPICGGSTEGCIYEAAGYDDLLEARKGIGYLEVCDVGLTPAFKLDAMYIIHVSAPRWNNGHSGEKVALKLCYQKVLRQVQELGCRSVAFSLLSSGAYRFPKDVALTIAKDAIEEYLKVNAPDDSEESINVMLVLYDDEAIKVSELLFSQIQEYINAHYVPEEHVRNEQSYQCQQDYFRDNVFFENSYTDKEACSEQEEDYSKELFVVCEENHSKLESKATQVKSKADFDKSIKELLDDPRHLKLFRDRMNELMQERNISAATIEKDGNIDRKHFSKINSNKVKPSKGAVIAIAIGLKLNYLEAVDFLAYAGYALSPSSKTDLIVQFFMENKALFYHENPDRNQYKVLNLNDILMQHGENTLGAGKDIKPI